MTKDRKSLWMQGALFIVYVLLAPTLIIPFLATVIIYEGIFHGRSDRMKPSLTLEDFPFLQADRVTFKSGRNTLAGAFYHGEQTDYKAVMVLGHGIGCCKDGYLNRIGYFVKKNYLVFSFDMTATAQSTGRSMRGLPQAQLDLERAIEFVKQRPESQGLPLVVYGHSWSGYASAAMLNDDLDGIVALATLSGFNNAFDGMYVQGYRYTGNLFLCAKPWIYLYQWLKYGKHSNYQGMNGVNHFKGNVLVAHSKDDPTVPFDISVYAQKDKCTNPKAEFLLYEDRGHTLSRPVASEDRIKEDSKGKRYREPYDGCNIFHYNVRGHYAWSSKEDVYAIDQDFMDQVDDFYVRAIEKDRLQQQTR